MNGENAKIWKVTRFCCTSGQCIDCHRRGHRVRIVHADNITKPLADRMVAGWRAYDAKTEPMR